MGFGEVEEGGDGDGGFAGGHLVTEAIGVLLGGFRRVVIGVESRDSVEIRLASGTKFVGQGEAYAAPVAIIGGDIGGRPFNQDGQGLDGFGSGERSGHNRTGLM